MINYFPILTSAPILRHLTSFTPGGGAILEAITGIGDATTIRDYLQDLRGSGILRRFEDLAARDLEARRDAGELHALDADEDFGFVAAWNAFVEADPGSPMSEEARELLCGPALRRIEAQFVNLATRSKNAKGQVRDHHVDRPIEPGTIEARIAGAEAELLAALHAGDTTDLGVGHPTSRARNGAAKVLLRAGQPVIMVRRAGAQVAWHEAELRRVVPAPSPVDLDRLKLAQEAERLGFERFFREKELQVHACSPRRLNADEQAEHQTAYPLWFWINSWDDRLKANWFTVEKLQVRLLEIFPDEDIQNYWREVQEEFAADPDGTPSMG